MKTTGLIWIQSFYFEVNIFYNVRMYNVSTKYLFQIKAQDTMVWPENMPQKGEKRPGQTNGCHAMAILHEV